MEVLGEGMARAVGAMYPDISSSDCPPLQSSSAPRRDSTSTTRTLMGECVLLGEEKRPGEVVRGTGARSSSLRLGPRSISAQSWVLPV